MATLTSNKVGAGTPAKSLSVGLVAVTATYSVNTSLSVGDVIQMINVPKGARVVYLATSGIGTNQEAIVSIGDGVLETRYLSATTMSASTAAPLYLPDRCIGVPYVYSTDDTIDLTISTVSLDTIGGAFNMTVIFSKDTA